MKKQQIFEEKTVGELPQDFKFPANLDGSEAVLMIPTDGIKTSESGEAFYEIYAHQDDSVGELAPTLAKFADKDFRGNPCRDLLIWDGCNWRILIFNYESQMDRDQKEECQKRMDKAKRKLERLIKEGHKKP